MKIYLSAVAALALASCGQPTPEKVEDVAANNMAADDVTEVHDESAMPVAEDEGDGGSDAESNDSGAAANGSNATR